MKKLSLLCLAVVLLCSVPAFAGSSTPGSSAYTWSGCYVGLNVGYGRQKNSALDTTVVPHFNTNSDFANGAVGGTQGGCDYALSSRWQIGVQALFNGAGLGGNHFLFPQGGDELLETETSWYSTATARLGYALAPQAFLYAKGGFAFARLHYRDRDHTTGFFDYRSRTVRRGWTIGGGGEYSFAPHWSAFAEYNYIDLGSRDTTLNQVYANGGYPNVVTFRTTHQIQTILVGMNYRFNVW